MENKIPFGVKLTRAFNLVTIVLNFIIAVLLVCIAVPNLVKASVDAGKPLNPIIGWLVALVMFLVFSIPAILLIKINKALMLLKEKSRIWQIVISFFLIFAFPVGTAMYAVVLYYMFIDKTTKAAFSCSTTAGLSK